ncbi:MAG: WD40/YVTN/BNR-like repeat-containing protein, partial [Candidatus Korobacteraceae bacterium]
MLLAAITCWTGKLAADSAASRWALLGPDGGDVRSLALDPRNPDRIFLGTSAGQMYLSTDRGESWSHFAHLGEGDDYVLDDIAVDPESPEILYAAAWSVVRNSGDVFRSRDGGRTWAAMQGMHGKSVRSFAVAPSNPQVLVAGALDGVYRSIDGGDSWERISPESHAEIKNVESLAIDPRAPDVIYIGTWHLPWKTYDGGRTWKPIHQGIIDDSDVFSIIVDQSDPMVIYLSACSGIYKSKIAGHGFQQLHQGIPSSARRTRVLRQDPLNPAVVYAGTTEGLWKTTDGGSTWTRTTAANVIVNDLVIDPRDPSRVLIATDRAGVLASSDGGLTMVASNSGFAHRQVAALLVDRVDANVFYA